MSVGLTSNEPADGDLTPAERAELDARLARFRSDPTGSTDWDEFEKDLDRRFGTMSSSRQRNRPSPP